MSNELSFRELMDVVDRARPLGFRTLENGTQLVGHLPDVGPEAWLHQIFGPLDETGIRRVEKQVGIKLPPEFEWFLRQANGLSLFSGSLAVYGLRESYARSGDAAWQPFAIDVPNTLERPRDGKGSSLFVGGYRADGSLLYIDADNSSVYRCSRDSARPLNQWPSLLEMLAREAKRLSRLFDEKGHKLDPKASTAPVPARAIDS